MPPTRLPASFDELTSEPAERRRIQNRIAQRKFRRKATGMGLQLVIALIQRLEKLSQKRKLEAVKQGSERRSPTHDEPHGDADTGDLNAFPDEITLEFDEAITNDINLQGPDVSFECVLDNTSDPHCSPYDSHNHVDDSTGRDLQDDLALALRRPPPERRRTRSGSDSTLDDWLTATHIAAEKGHSRILEMLLAQPGACVNERDGEGKTALIYATREGHETCVRVLLARGATVDRTDNVTGWTSLHWAVINHNLPILRILLDHGSRDSNFDVDAWDISGWTALHGAVECGFEEGAALLIQYGADLGCRARRCNITGAYTPREVENLVRIALKRKQVL